MMLTSKLKRSRILRDGQLFDERFNPKDSAVLGNSCIEFHVTGNAWRCNPNGFN